MSANEKNLEKQVESDLAENSQGLRHVTQATDQLIALSGRSLDVGCGVGYVLERFSSRPFYFHPYGVDICENAITKATNRLQLNLGNASERVIPGNSSSLPFEDDFFALVTCFDVLEHLPEEEVFKSLCEISRVTRSGGVFFGSVSCRGERSTDWWIERTQPDRAVYDGHRRQLVIWKRAPFGDRGQLFQLSSEDSRDKLEHHPADSKELYQKIYDENPWYGDATEGRCPGVRLLPQYQDWLIGPVIDLGCGRGHTVEKLRELGFEAAGVDQIKKHPEMMVGDITKPLENMARFKSATCIDCIEHLYDEQVQGLFANMKQVQRQAFSIHNGESTGTGQELHVNRRPFAQWRTIIEEHFVIEKEIALHDRQMLYLTSAR